MTSSKITPQKPYLVKAMIDWVVDNGLTPHILVDTTVPFVQVPQEFIDNNKIVLNIAPQAVGEFRIDHVWISFFTRFSGKEYFIQLPIGAVVAVYASENTQGMGFDVYAPSIEELEKKDSPKVVKKVNTKPKPVLSIATVASDDKPAKVRKKAEPKLKASEEELEISKPKKVKQKNNKEPIKLQVVKKNNE